MFIEVVLIEERRRAEALSDALVAAGALSASVEDADAGSPDEQPLYGEPGLPIADSAWRRSRIVALFDEAAPIDAVLQSAFADAGIVDPPSYQRRTVADADWIGLTQSQFEPIAIGMRLWIVPSWHEPPPAATAADAIVLRLDPGMAFGTGDHPTTRLCLAWLEQHVRPGDRVIDYGSGSGILAIAAKKLGAGTVVGTDIDEWAVAAATANAVSNDVDVAFVTSASFRSDAVDLVVANILSDPLKVLAPLLVALVAPGGRLVLSGVLERQAVDVAAAYAPAIALVPWRSDAGWVCLVGRRDEDDGRGGAR